MNTPEFTQRVDLAAEKVGGKALMANDDFFAPKENLLKAAEPIFIPEKFTENGKWMDGWESRRSRTPGYDWCIIQLGIPGAIDGFDVWTEHFRGNYPEHCSIEVCESADEDIDSLLSTDTHWVELVPKSRLEGHSHNYFEVYNPQRWTHVRLNIYPDGGVARFRVYGEALPDWDTLAKEEQIELSGIQNGGEVLLCNDMFFSPKENLILPGKAANMGEGWETRRRREPGHDWLILKLGTPGHIEQIDVDTSYFKGNYPDACSIDGLLLQEEVPADFLMSRSLSWQEILPAQKLSAHEIHSFSSEIQHQEQIFSHLRLNIYPDGGISRLRVYGRVSRFARFNESSLPQAKEAFARCCGAREWVRQMLSEFPYETPEQLRQQADHAADQLREQDWLEAFSHHPQIGDLDSLREKYAGTADLAEKEQAGSMSASEETLKALAEGNQKYLDKFGFIFIVCASGKSADEMLALLQERLDNDRDTELRIAAGEQRKITHLRLEQLI